MRFLIAETFTKSIDRLDGRTRGAVKSVAFDLLSRPDDRGHRQHRLAHAKDRRFWSVRVSRDVRIIVLRTDEEAVLCFAGHHDEAYAWAVQRRIGHAACCCGIVELADRERGTATCAPRPGAPEHAPMDGSIGSRLAQAGRGVGASSSVDALHRESLPPSSGAQPRRFRMRNRAVAPLPVSSPARAAGPSGAPPLVELLRLARASSAPSAAGAREPASRVASSPARAAQRPLAYVRAVAIAAAALASAFASVGARDLALRDVASLFVVGIAAASAAAAVVTARQRAAARAAVAAVTMLRDQIRAGRLDATVDQARVEPELRPLLRAVDEVVAAFAEPFSSMTATLACIARGELPPRLTKPFHGDFERHRSAIDALAEFVLLSPEGIRELVDTAHTRPPRDEPRRDAQILEDLWSAQSSLRPRPAGTVAGYPLSVAPPRTQLCRPTVAEEGGSHFAREPVKPGR